MARCWLMGTVLAAALLAPSSAAAEVRDGLLGAPCALDSDCAAGGLGCFLASAELGTPGPSGGLCTAPCFTDEDCQTVNAAAVCLGGVCLEGCTPGSWFGAALDPDKCHGREDMACSSQDPSAIFATTSIEPACTPRCASDAACGPDLFCNPSTGLCDPAPPTGDPPGARCDLFGANTCAGVCVGVCAEPCVLGAANGCSASSATSPLGAACLSAFGGSGVGDLGTCDALCNCSSDCPPDTFCEPLDLGGRFDEAGLCSSGPRPAGAPDCLEGSAGAGGAPDCPYGAVYPCRTTAGCLGTAECLPSGEYSECTCVPIADGGSAGSADAGAAGVEAGGSGGRDSESSGPAGVAGESSPGNAAGPTPDSGCGCSVPGTHTNRTALSFLGLLVVIALGRARSRRRALAAKHRVSRGDSSWIARSALLALLAAGCGQVWAYPDVVAEVTAAACSDGKDNDLDGKTDCEDPDCHAYCLENTDARCHDGKDNDFDGKADCKSADCAPYCVESTEETCHDGKDNDQNQKTDCADPACAAFCPEADQKACSDGIDNDSDGKIDCDDPDCDGFCPEESLLACNDGRDNDGDGLTDAADPRCWLLAAPQVQRCAEASGVEVVENFDANFLIPDVNSEWSHYGKYRASGVDFDAVFLAPHPGDSAGSRQDFEAGFFFNTTESQALDTNLAGLVRAWQFSGSWQGFELSFSASAPVGALLRVGIVPAALVPLFAPTRPGAEDALFALTLDGAHAPPTFTLEVDGSRVSAPLPVTRSLCAGGASFCDDDLSQVRVILDDQGFYATLQRPNGETAELRAPAPSSLSLPPSRLVFWGGTTELGTKAQLDDVHLSVAPDTPCGYVAPQIPGSTCDFKDDLRAFGHGVSLAQGSDGADCALVTASQDGSVPGPETLTAWTSPDGEIWAPASSPEAPPVDLPTSTTLVGAGIAHDDAGFHVAVAYRDGSDVRLGFAVNASCGAWGKLTPGPSLFADAEPPSYVIAAGQQAVYFTRPPTDQTHRTLWRLARGDSDSIWPDPELLAELPPNVGSPVSVQQIGARDLVLIHPTLASAGRAGVGLLVGDADAHSWHAVDPSPILDIPELVETYSGSLTFDDQGARSAALGWGQNGGFLLYGAASQRGLNLFYRIPTLSVGTARLVPAGQPFPPRSSTPVARCGDGTCDPNEDCALCPADCACGGAPLLSDVFSAAEPWQTVSTDPHPARVEYLDPEHAALNWAGGGDTWSVLPLEHAVGADFELSFDFLMAYTDLLLQACSAYVGLGTAPDLAGLAGTGGATPEGVFARVAYSGQCNGLYWTTPLVRSGGVSFTGPGEGVVTPADCRSADRYSPVETRGHVVLRREGNQVSVSMARGDACGLGTPQTVEYSGPLPDLPALLVGFGGPGFESCPNPQGQSVGAGTISNLQLRLLDDPSQCPATKQLCGTGSEQPSCVDTNRSVENCGACGHACAANEVCSGGACVCSSSPNVLSCDGVCVDSLTSLEHCGACDNACTLVCTAGVCDVFAGDCSSPIPLPPGAGTFALDFSKQKPDTVQLCNDPVKYEEVLSWTPSQSGTATLALQASGGLVIALLGISVDPTCSTVLTCGAGGTAVQDQPAILPVVAGTTYHLSVGFYAGDPSSGALELNIQVQ
jgi:MYXO-CTERM domain-containing protein